MTGGGFTHRRSRAIERASMRNRKMSVVDACILVAIGLVLFTLAAVNAGCGTIAGVGRDLTAMADGMAGDSSANADAIRSK